ncbi:MAG: hypothetical protein RL238_1164 [Actinomycetota bacterium]|jgi:uncharacterized pyridoxamine 5'-phosphate oxidase family protein
MHETYDDLAELQDLIERSAAAGGAHLKHVLTKDHRLSAEAVCSALQGMNLLVLATVSSDGRPIAGPVDGIFFRGHFHFGSDPNSLRFRHIRRNPHVSASHLPGEHLQITVHGKATLIDVMSDEQTAFREHLLSIYVPRYGEAWTAMLEGGAQYARIDAERMFTFWMPEEH